MNKQVTLNVNLGQQALVLTSDGLQALNRWMAIHDALLDLDEAGPDFLSASQVLKNAAQDLAIHVRAAYDQAQV